MAQDGRFDARRVTAWAEMIGVRREKREVMRSDLIVNGLSELIVKERPGCLIEGDNEVKMMTRKGALSMETMI